MADSTTTFLVLGAAVLLFVSGRVPVELVAIGVALGLAGAQVLEVEEALAGFGDPTVIFIATLFVVSEGLDASGTTTWVGERLIGSAGTSAVRLMVLMSLLVAALTALISVNGAVAALLPMIVVVAVRLDRPASQLLMPLAFAAHAGSMLALTGTPVSVIVSDAARDATGSGFGFFEFGLVGVPLLAGTIAILVGLGPRLLPRRHAPSVPPDLSEMARTLRHEYTFHTPVSRLRIPAGSGLVGAPVEAGVVGPELELVWVDDAHGARVTRSLLDAGDVMVVRGEPEDVHRLCARHALEEVVVPERLRRPELSITDELGVAELIVPPRSPLVGERVFPGMVTDDGELVVLAIQRRSQDLGPREVRLEVGDTLLVHGPWPALTARADADEALVVEDPDAVRRQAAPLGRRAAIASAIVAGMVVLLATGAVPSAVAGLLAASAMVLFGVLRPDQAYRSVSWTTVLLVGGMIPLSTAMQQSGAAEDLAGALLDVVGDSSPTLLVAGLFVLTAVLGQLISNMATALVVIPIAVSAAVEVGVSPLPVLMAVNVAAAASFLTPVATPVNMMVMGPADYRFGDYARMGFPLLVWFFLVATLLVPVVWRF